MRLSQMIRVLICAVIFSWFLLPAATSADETLNIIIDVAPNVINMAHPANEYLSIEKREWTWQEPQLFDCHRTTGGEIRPCPRLYSTMLLG